MIYLQQNVFDAGLERMRWLFDEFEEILISFSGGKDSTVLFNLALMVAREKNRLPLKVLWLDQEAEWQNVVEYVRSIMNMPEVEPYWFQGPFRLFNATTTEKDPWLHCWGEGEKWIRPKEPNSIHENKCGTDRFAELFPAFTKTYFPNKKLAQLGGVRCEESPARFNGLTSKLIYKHVTWGNTAGLKNMHYTFYPLYDWTWRDIWKAIHDNNWTYCNTGEAPIWMGDYSFKRIDEVKPGDDVIGFTNPTEKGDGENRSKLIRTKVLATSSRLTHVVKITMASGRVIRCTRDHMWVRSSPNGNWLRGDALYGSAVVGDNLAFVIDPEFTTPNQTGSWLGGIYDGEGCGVVISQSKHVNPLVFERIGRALKEIGVDYSIGDQKPAKGKPHGCNVYRVTGGRHGMTKFINATRPVKSTSAAVDKAILGGRFKMPDRVVSIEPDGVDRVYALQTECGTYVAWGYASKNCKIYDYMYQCGEHPKNMRVSNVHHETSIHCLRFLQEIEPDTWNRIVERVPSIGAVTKVKECYECPKALPPVFKTWREYRDYLLEHMIDEDFKHKFRNRWASWDKTFVIEEEAVEIDLMRNCIAGLLVNDHEFVKNAQYSINNAHNTRRGRERRASKEWIGK